MEYDQNEEPILVKLKRGETVQCKECGTGIYRPFNADYKRAHSFVCDKCGTVRSWTPSVIVE